MDIDTPPIPTPSIPLDDFSLRYPLPFRILLLTFLTVVGFATNLHILSSLGIDTSQVLDIRLDHPGSISSNGNSNPPPLVHPTKLYQPLYRLGLSGVATTTTAWFVYKGLTRGLEGRAEMEEWKWFPALVALGLTAVCFVPWNWACRRQRFMFLRSLKRIVSPNLLKTVPFSDVILADILTSSAKVLGDVWLAGSYLVSTTSSAAGEGKNGSKSRVWGVPLMVALPYIFRFRQCLSEVVTQQTPTPRRSLLNALKYATAFPVILLSAMQTVVGDPFDDEKEMRIAGDREEERWIGRNTLFTLWVLAVLINSLYSFWWDITNDWGLSLLVPSGWSSQHSLQSSYQLVPRHAPSSTLPPSTSSQTNRSSDSLHTRTRSNLSPTPSSSSGSLHPSTATRNSSSRHTRAFSTAQSPNISYPFLRPILLLPDPTIYYLAIALDLLLRLTWSLKLTPHLHEMGDLESGVFVMELLEVLRRWGWVYLRIEWEAVRKGQGGELDGGNGAGGGGGGGVSWLERGEGERRLRLQEEFEMEQSTTRKNGTIALAREEEDVGVTKGLLGGKGESLS
ncbi:Erd1p [Sporobolomyces salmoneus]|uniref:Erd1p n=1 Tax=Sporobolomyces salmoneus TaxID=183962 RepID=UPI0031715D74